MRKWWMIFIIAMGQGAAAYNSQLKKDNGPDEEKLKAFLQREFGAASIEINSYDKPKDPRTLFEKNLSRTLKFTATQDGVSAAFECEATVSLEGMYAAVSRCKPGSAVSLAQKNKFPRFSEDKTYVYDYLDDKTKDDDVDAKFAAYKARLGFTSYNCDHATPRFEYYGAGESLSLVAAKDSPGFVLYSTPKGQEASRVASGDVATLTIMESYGPRKVDRASIDRNVDEIHGVKNLAISAGAYRFKDLRDVSELLEDCCDHHEGCPSAQPALPPKFFVKDIGVSR